MRITSPEKPGIMESVLNTVFDIVEGSPKQRTTSNNHMFFQQKQQHANNTMPKKVNIELHFEAAFENKDGLCGNLVLRKDARKMIESTDNLNMLIILADIRKDTKGNSYLFSPLFNDRGVLLDDGALGRIITDDCSILTGKISVKNVQPSAESQPRI